MRNKTSNEKVVSASTDSSVFGELDDESRREALGRMGRFAYAAPSMLLLVDPANAKDEYKVKKPKPKP
jgi:hypothetical protein